MLVLFAGVVDVLPAEGGRKGASSKAYEHASEKAVFHRIQDWFATRGKSDEEKKAIRAKREIKKKEARAEKMAKKEAKKGAKAAKKKAKSKVRKKARKRGSGKHRP